MLFFPIGFTFPNKSPSASVVEENAATLFCYKAPEMFCKKILPTFPTFFFFFFFLCELTL